MCSMGFVLLLTLGDTSVCICEREDTDTCICVCQFPMSDDDQWLTILIWRARGGVRGRQTHTNKTSTSIATQSKTWLG